jgi:Flp pilus assembly protein TadG
MFARRPAGRRAKGTTAGSERGSAVAEFVMVLVLLLMLFLSLVSLALWAYTHTVLTSAAAQAARYAANADVPDNAAAARVAEIMSGGLTGQTARTVHCVTANDADLVGVTCTMTAPGIVPLLAGVLPDITVTGHAAAEHP